MIIVDGWKPLTIATKCSNLDVAAVLDQPLRIVVKHHEVIILNRSNNTVFLYLETYWNRQVFDFIRDLFNFYLSKIKCKRPEVNTEPTHFPTLMNNGKAFSSLDSMACSYQCSDQFSFYQGTDKPKNIGFLETLKHPIYLKIISITPGIIWSLKFKTKKQWWNCGIINTNIKQNY